MRIEFISGNVLSVIRLDKTSNDKIADPKEKIVQTYHYSRDQFQEAQRKTSMKNFFSKDKDVCLDCPYSMSNGAELKGCYTHKPIQYSGMISQLRSVAKKHKSWEDIPQLNEVLEAIIVGMCAGRYVRFGTYGESVMVPVGLVGRMVNVAKSWSGYTHQWNKPWAYDYRDFFMASTHSMEQTEIAGTMGWRSFMDDVEKTNRPGMVGCPASKEGGYKSNCSKCMLCSGIKGKGTKSVYIFNHS